MIKDKLLSTLNNIDSKTLQSTDSHLTKSLLYGSISFDTQTTIDYTLSTESLETLFFRKKHCFSYAIQNSEFALIY